MQPRVTLLAAAILLAGAPPLRAEGPGPLRVIASAGLRGRLAEPLCQADRAMVAHPAASFLGPLAEAGALPDALVVDTGGLLNPHGVSRFAARERPEALARVARDLGYDLLALGEDDLGAPRGRVVGLARLLAGHGVPYAAHNLVCSGAASELCDVVLDATDPPQRASVAGEEVAVVALLDPHALGRIAPDRAEGLVLTPVSDALPPLVRAARASGATVVVAVLDLSAEAALALPRALPEDARPDLVLLPDAGVDLLFARPATVRPAIAAPAPGSGLVVRVNRMRPDSGRLEDRAEALRGGLDLVATPLELPPGAVAGPVAAFAAEIGEAYCQAFDRPLAGGRLDPSRPLDAHAMGQLAAELIREFAEADVAVLNPTSVASGFSPSDPRELTASDLYIALEYDEPLVVADVPVDWLLKLRPRAATHGLLMPGLCDQAPDPARLSVDHLRVRDRKPVERATYRVATIRFLASGGDGALPALPEGVRWRSLTELGEDGVVRYQSLRDAALAVLGEASGRDPRDAREDPNQAVEWVLSAQLDGDLAGASVTNPDGQEAALLSTRTSATLGGDLSVAASASSPTFAWESSFFGVFRTQWSPDLAGGGGFVEANDQLQLRSMASWRGLRRDAAEVWIPDPYLEVFVESEITQPAARDWHWLLVRPTLGARFPLTDKLDLKVQGGVQASPLDPGGEVEAGLGALVNLRPLLLAGALKRGLRLDGQLDFFWLDLLDEDRWQLRGQLNLALDLGGPLALTFGTVWYAQGDADRAPGLALTATAGLRLGAVTRAIPAR
jgi:hypothetical protein